MNREESLKAYIDVLKDFATDELANRAWVEKEEGIIFELWDFVEWLDDLGLNSKNSVLKSGIQNDEYESLAKVDNLLKGLAEMNKEKSDLYEKNPELLLNTDAWNRIKEEANSSLRLLKSRLDNEFPKNKKL